MENMSKDQVFMEVASGMASFYAIMGHNLRVLMEDEVSIQMPPGEVQDQFRQIHDALKPQVSGNPVVSNKLKDDFETTMKLAGEFSNPKLNEGRLEEVKEEALRLHFYARERSASLSDLVAVFRSL
jgi:hypothetical protein